MTTQDPERTCIGCGARRPKRTLIRLALMEEGRVRVDAQQTSPGRGAYLCGGGCLGAAAKRRAFQRAFRGKAALDLPFLEAALKARN